jgi:hypothetical protein
MAKPNVKATGGGAPCLFCGKYIWEGENKTLIASLEKHYLLDHNPVVSKSNKNVPNRDTEPMFDRDPYLNTKRH